MSTSVSTTPSTPTYVDTTKYWNFVFPAALFVVGGFALHVAYSLSDVQTARSNAFNRGAIPSNLSLNLKLRNTK